MNMLLCLLLVAVILYTVIRFYRAGFIASALYMSAPIFSLLFTASFGGRVADIFSSVISEKVQSELIAKVISYALAYPITFISIFALFLITVRITKKINIPVLSVIDKGIGGVLGFAVGLVSVIVISLAFHFVTEFLGIGGFGGDTNIADGIAVSELFELIGSK